VVIAKVRDHFNGLYPVVNIVITGIILIDGVEERVLRRK
jgi:hypothetical protein